LIASASKSVVVLPASTLPRRLIAAAVKRSASARDVFPAPPCETRATLRICSVLNFFMMPRSGPFRGNRQRGYTSCLEVGNRYAKIISLLSFWRAGWKPALRLRLFCRNPFFHHTAGICRAYNALLFHNRRRDTARWTSLSPPGVGINPALFYYLSFPVIPFFCRTKLINPPAAMSSRIKGGKGTD